MSAILSYTNLAPVGQFDVLLPTVIGFYFFRGSLVTRWEAPGGFGAFSGLWLATFSLSTLMLLVGSFDL